MKRKKILFLTLALLLPVAIFIFLKMFGRNEFAVPPLYEEGQVEHPERCDFRYTTPYSLPDSLSESLGLHSEDSLFVLYFESGLDAAMNRVMVESKRDVKIIASYDLDTDSLDVTLLKDCILLMKPEHSVVLIDHRKRIRAYYDGSDRDEIDRLIIEINVILKRY